VYFVGIDDDDRCNHDRFDHHLVGRRVHHVERDNLDDPPGGN
jgi:hypothetical protein